MRSTREGGREFVTCVVCAVTRAVRVGEARGRRLAGQGARPCEPHILTTVVRATDLRSHFRPCGVPDPLMYCMHLACGCSCAVCAGGVAPEPGPWPGPSLLAGRVVYMYEAHTYSPQSSMLRAPERVLCSLDTAVRCDPLDVAHAWCRGCPRSRSRRDHG